MFMNDGRADVNPGERYLEPRIETEADDYRNLLDTVNAARTGLGSGEHDYDDLEVEAL